MSGARIGVFGGSFDPVHNGHVRVAEIVHRECDLDTLLFVPTSQTRWKELHASAADRLAMTTLAARNYSYCEVSDVDILRGGATRTLDTLSDLHQQYPEDTLVFITGADSAAAFHHWYQWRRILEIAELVGVSRPGHTLRTEQLDLGVVRQVEADTLNISSTECRRRVRCGESLSGWVPDPVARYIVAENLYRY